MTDTVVRPNFNQTLASEDKLALHRILRSVKLHHLILIACVLFVAWGPGMQKVTGGIDLTKLFSVLGAGLIAYWLLLRKRKFGVFPKEFNWFILFVIGHTLLVYTLFVSEPVSFGYSYYKYTADGFAVRTESNGINLARFFFNVFFTYACASLLRNKNEMVAIALAFCICVAFTITFGSHVSENAEMGWVRYTGGFINANILGSMTRVAFFLNIFVLSYRRNPTWIKLLAAFLMIPTLYGLLCSVSRLAIISTCLGTMVMLLYQPFRQKVRWLVNLALIAVVIIFLIPTETKHSIFIRFMDKAYIERTIKDTRGQIVKDYLQQWPSYVCQGVGLNRATNVIESSYHTSRVFIPHQTYLELLVEFGFAGLLLFLAATWNLWKRISVQQPRWSTDPAMLGLLASWVFFFAFGTYGSRDFWLSWAILAAYGSWKCEWLKRSKSLKNGETKLTDLNN